jgi:hypothetical protein
MSCFAYIEKVWFDATAQQMMKMSMPLNYVPVVRATACWIYSDIPIDSHRRSSPRRVGHLFCQTRGDCSHSLLRFLAALVTASAVYLQGKVKPNNLGLEDPFTENLQLLFCFVTCGIQIPSSPSSLLCFASFNRLHRRSRQGLKIARLKSLSEDSLSSERYVYIRVNDCYMTLDVERTHRIVGRPCARYPSFCIESTGTMNPCVLVAFEAT